MAEMNEETAKAHALKERADRLLAQMGQVVDDGRAIGLLMQWGLFNQVNQFGKSVIPEVAIVKPIV